ncbi:hypothetical protein LTR84_006504 [Exophiala bonariae]|uniref:Uncharacterized protein n=1 Tax=Exophiala bonariae TaxID=1690606 RepID=A0AAV9N3D0_9EURO|nr:hypothetical protein LTR84_006504 [Exophiala bonariae]
MSGFSTKVITADGLEFAFALQYQARVVIDALLLPNLAASGDGRIVHLSGAVPSFVMADLDDLQFEKTKFSFWKAILGTHNLSFMFIQEARQRWKDRAVSITAVCVGSTKTKAMSDPNMPFLMRLMGYFGTTAELSAQNVIKVMTTSKISHDDRFGVMWNPKKPEIKSLPVKATTVKQAAVIHTPRKESTKDWENARTAASMISPFIPGTWLSVSVPWAESADNTDGRDAVGRPKGSTAPATWSAKVLFNFALKTAESENGYIQLVLVVIVEQMQYLHIANPTAPPRLRAETIKPLVVALLDSISKVTYARSYKLEPETHINSGGALS